MNFQEFYSTIRGHFATNHWEYEKYRHNKTNQEKVEHLLGHKIVQESLTKLVTSNNQIPLCSIFGAPNKTKEEKSPRQFPPNLVNGGGVKKYPQMSKKIELKVTKKKGRMLVAKDKIEPGTMTQKSTVLFRNCENLMD